MNQRILIAIVAALPLLGGCIKHKIETEPIEIKPIHITVDVNVRVQERLKEVFAFEEEIEGQYQDDVDLRR